MEKAQGLPLLLSFPLSLAKFYGKDHPMATDGDVGIDDGRRDKALSVSV
jgi:hypothetical protein